MSAVPARRSSIAPAVTAADPAAAPVLRARRNTQSYGLPTQRDRLVAATGQLAAELGSSAIGVHHICQRAGVSRRTFYDLFADRDACFIDAHQEAFSRLVGHVAEAVAEGGAEWEDRAVAATQALLSAWDADRVLAHLCLVAAVSGSSETLALRRTAIVQVAGAAGRGAGAAVGRRAGARGRHRQRVGAGLSQLDRGPQQLDQ